MSTDTVYAWSTTADSNDTADAEIDWREYQAAATVNNSARAMMRRVAQVLDDLAPNVTSTGSVNTYAVSSSSTGGGASLNDGEIIEFIPHVTNTTACTLARDSKGAVPWRPKSGTEFGAGDIVAGVPVKATYRLASNEWLSSTPGYVFRTTAASYLTSHTFGLRVGDVKLSLASAPDDGFIRLTETTQALVKADYPDLDAWASGQGYPWGSTSTTFNVPPAGGYFLRFGATDSTVDPSGPRTAGSTQADAFKSHTHTASVTDPGHTHTNVRMTQTGQSFTGPGGGTAWVPNSTEATGASTTGITVSNAATGDTNETRAKNVAMFADMLALPAVVATQLIGALGLAYRFNSSTAAGDPGSGYFTLDAATPSSATQLRLSETDALGASIAAFIQTIPSGAKLQLTKIGTPASVIRMTLAAAPSDAGAYETVSITSVSSSGTISHGDLVSITVMGGLQTIDNVAADLVYYNLAATRAPTGSDDATQNYTAGSQWYDASTGVMWTCLDVTTNGAAVWSASEFHPGVRAGALYPTFRGVHNTGTAYPGVSTIYAYPFRVAAKISVSSLVFRCVTGAASSNLKAAIYANNSVSGTGFAKPVGAPIAVCNTGQSSATSNSAVTCPVSTVVLWPGLYWMASKSDGAASFVSISATDYAIEEMIGRAAANGNTSVTGVSTSDTYSSNFPTLSGSETWSEVLSSGIPIARIG